MLTDKDIQEILELLKKQEEPEEAGKLFIGGLSWGTSYDGLFKHFSRYGELKDCIVMTNNNTGRPRGFGFVQYVEPTHIVRVFDDWPHILDGRTVDIKICKPRCEQVIHKRDSEHKLFLGGLPLDVTETELRRIFQQFGELDEVIVMFDQLKKKPRGFGFVSFKTEEPTLKLLERHYILIKCRRVEVKKAAPRGLSNTYYINLMHKNEMKPHEPLSVDILNEIRMNAKKDESYKTWQTYQPSNINLKSHAHVQSDASIAANAQANANANTNTNAINNTNTNAINNTTNLNGFVLNFNVINANKAHARAIDAKATNANENIIKSTSQITNTGTCTHANINADVTTNINANVNGSKEANTMEQNLNKSSNNHFNGISNGINAINGYAFRNKKPNATTMNAMNALHSNADSFIKSTNVKVNTNKHNTYNPITAYAFNMPPPMINTTDALSWAPFQIPFSTNTFMTAAYDANCIISNNEHANATNDNTKKASTITTTTTNNNAARNNKNTVNGVRQSATGLK